MSKYQTTRWQRKLQSGFTLVELMIAMLLGLIVIGGVVSVFLANQQTYRTNAALGDVQDSARIAFELMAQDIRDAGLTGCNSTPDSARVANVLTNSPGGGGTAVWWADWNNSVHGYDGASAATSPDPALSGLGSSVTYAPNTDSIQLIGVDHAGVSVNVDTETAGTFTLNETSTNLVQGDVVVVCDPDHSTVVQLTAVSGTTLTHGMTGTPGNCSQGLGFPTVCSSAGNGYTFKRNALIARLNATDWFVGTGADGVSSLYRVDLENKAGVPTPTAQQMVRNVSDLQIQYHLAGAVGFVDAGSVTNWPGVDAVRVTLTLQSADQRAGTNAKPLQRTLTSTTSLRNRVH